MSESRTAKRAIQLPLIGVAFLWAMMMLAQYVDLYREYQTYDKNGVQLPYEITLQWSVYLILLGITGVAVASLLGQRIALALRMENDSPLALSAHRFNNLFVILSLVGGAVFAIGNFLGAFNTYDSRDASPLVRIFGVYVPIVLATALVVVVILFAFVFRKDAPDIAHEERDEERARLQRAVGLAYASPIIGTRFAAQARSAKPIQPKPRRTGTAAVNLNFVLSIVFGVAVTIMAFSFGFAAIESLREWPQWDDNDPMSQQPFVNPISLTWFLEKLLPALVLLGLATFGVYRTMISRNREVIA